MRGGCGLRVVGWLHRLNRRPKVREEAGWLLIVRALHPLINADCLNLGPSSSVLTILPLQPRVVGRRRRRRRILSGMLTRAGIVGILRVYRLVSSTIHPPPLPSVPSEEEFSPPWTKEEGNRRRRMGEFRLKFASSSIFFFFFFHLCTRKNENRDTRGYSWKKRRSRFTTIRSRSIDLRIYLRG